MQDADFGLRKDDGDKKGIHICASVDEGEAKCYEVPAALRQYIMKEAQLTGYSTHETKKSCVKDDCNFKSAIKLALSEKGKSMKTQAVTSCLSENPDTFICGVRGAGFNFNSQSLNSSESNTKQEYASSSPTVPKSGTSEQMIQRLAQEQKYQLLGQQANRIMQDTGVTTELLTRNSWGSPFGGAAQLLGDGSAIIARLPGAASRLSTSPNLSEGQQSSLAARDAPVLGALDAIQQSEPLGYVDARRPSSAWTVGSELSTRFPQAVLAGPQQQEASLASALFTVQNNSSQNLTLAERGGNFQAHFCCAGKENGCVLQAVPPDTKGCHRVSGVDMLGAAEAKCLMNCTGEVFQELRPDAVCFKHGECEATRRWQVGERAQCYASQEVCQVATAQSRAMNVHGSTYT